MHETSAATDAYRRRVDQQGWAPRTCVWELTLACNLRCTHCGSLAGRRRCGELTTAESLDVVRQLAELRCELITLSGGEPTLRSDWDTIARAVAERGMYVNMVTNGVYRDAEAARGIARRAVDAGLCNVGVSLDGPRAVHDRIRGAGTFTRTLAAVEAFRRVGLAVSVMTTVSRLNLPWLHPLRQILVDAGAADWRLQLAKPMGALSGSEDFVLQPEQMLDLVPLLARLKRRGGITLRVGDSIGYYGPHDKVLRGRGWRGSKECWKGCQAGMQAIGIEADGGVKGCLSLQARAGARDPFLEGNLRESALAAIWYRPGVFAFNRDLAPAQLTGYCADCRYAALCRGGARCVSSAAAGVLTEDPYCFYRVASMAAPAPRRWSSATATMAAVMLAVAPAACDSRATPADDAGPAITDARNQADATASDSAQQLDLLTDVLQADAGTDAAVIDCAEVCCACDYGVLPPDVWQACCAPDPCENACCECDYGLPPPAECCP